MGIGEGVNGKHGADLWRMMQQRTLSVTDAQTILEWVNDCEDRQSAEDLLQVFAALGGAHVIGDAMLKEALSRLPSD